MGMKFNLREEKDVFIETEKLGKLFIFKLNLKEQGELLKEINNNIEGISPVEYAKLLIKYSCYPENKLTDGKYKPDQPSLCKDDVDLLLEVEIESFAEKYIGINDHLFRETIAIEKKEETGKSVLSIEKGDIQYPKKDNESFVDYLHRLSVVEVKKVAEMMAATFESMSGFSKKLQEQLKESLSFGDSLRRSYENIKPLESMSKSSMLSKLAEMTPPYTKVETFSDAIKRGTDSLAKPISNLSDRLDELINISKNQTVFLVDMNESQVGIASELKTSGKTTTRFTIVNIFISIIIVVLTAIAAFYTYKSYNSSSLDKNMTSLVNEISHLNNNMNTNQQLILKLIEQQRLTISELKNIQNQNQNRINLLESKLNKEKGFKN